MEAQPSNLSEALPIHELILIDEREESNAARFSLDKTHTVVQH
jgi:hypothetical protein